MSEIAVPSTIRTFSETQEEEFLAYVRAVDANTITVPIETPADVALADDGSIARDGYRFSQLAFSQLCQCVASGLSTLVEDISGLRRRENVFDDVISVPTAVRILNTCVELRFLMDKGPYGRLMVRDMKQDIVEGVVGPGYRYLPHCALYEAVRDMLVQGNPPARFAGAQLIGRRLALCMVADAPLFRTKTGDSYYGGYYFSNSEAGECSVGAASLLGLGGAGMRCIGGMTGMGRVSHCGKYFNKKLGHLLGGVLVDPRQAATLVANADRLLTQPLNVLKDNKLHAARIEGLIDRLNAQGLPRTIAKEVLRWAVYAGAHGKEIPARMQPSQLARRTWYDVFVSMLRRASGLAPVLREPTEQIAFRLLLGKFKLN